jgi:hypothetical protein
LDEILVKAGHTHSRSLASLLDLLKGLCSQNPDAHQNRLGPHGVPPSPNAQMMRVSSAWPLSRSSKLANDLTRRIIDSRRIGRHDSPFEIPANGAR